MRLRDLELIKIIKQIDKGITDWSVMADLEEAGIIGYGPTTPRPVQRPPMEEQIRQGRMQRFETDFEEQVRNRFPA